MMFTAIGFTAALVSPEIETGGSGHAAVHLIAEATLVLILFSAAARIDIAAVREDHNLSVRMLAIGLPLIKVFGTFAALALLSTFSIWEAALLAALLAH